MKEILKYLRQVNSFSQEQIAQKLGISRQSYIKYENGSVIPNNSTVHHLAAIYGVSEEFIRSNKIPSVKENSIKEAEYKMAEEKNLEVASPEYVMKAPVQQTRQTYEGIFDGNCVRILGDHNFTKGQKIIMWEENEEEADERRQKAWETILSMRKSVPNDFDYKKELLEALDEKYNSTH
nr:helix-turn-helix transcriptional regulator [uncultured Treponema sp.]